MEGFTEATDITTPVEMRAKDRARDDNTSAQVSELVSSEAAQMRPKSATLYDVTDPESDMEDNTPVNNNNNTEEQKAADSSLTTDKTLVPELPPTQEARSEATVSADQVELRMKKREVSIDRRFARLSQEVMAEAVNAEEVQRVYHQLSLEEEEGDDHAAAVNFDKIVQDNFAEDKSEDWLSNEDSSPGAENLPPLKQEEELPRQTAGEWMRI